ncbi:MAG: hypothetical protein H6835_10435 [Planctomycetes bacterium]|nr:hypothetical protein [Planctomycetota bacterium]
MADSFRSLPGVADVTWVRGAAAGDAAPTLLLEVPHGATRAVDFDDLRAALRGDYAADLRDFFYVNTDVGAPELATAIARDVVAARPDRAALVVRCLMPRTFLDTNRVVDPAAAARPSAVGEMTPGLMPWVVDEHDRALLLERYAAYRQLTTDAFDVVCGGGGRGLCVHSYAPRSVAVDVDRDIVGSLRAAYAPDKVATWALRSPVDLITDAPDGAAMADGALAAAVEREMAARDVGVVRNGAYSLFPSTMAFLHAQRHPGRTLCFEVRRDLLCDFVPFVELAVDGARVAKVATAFSRALLEVLP